MTEKDTITDEQMYGKVRYKRLISNNFCNEEFEVESPARADKLFEKLREFEDEGVAFVDRALKRHHDYMNKKERTLYRYDDEDNDDDEEEEETPLPMRCEECDSTNLETHRDSSGSLWGKCKDCEHDTEFGYIYEKDVS
jgi:hypothetical protein